MSEKDIFMEVWAERPHFSFLSNRPIKYFAYSNFAHVLPKSKYPKYRLRKENIVLLLPEEHYMEHSSSKKVIEEYCKKYLCSWEKIVSLREELIAKYNEEFDTY